MAVAAGHTCRFGSVGMAVTVVTALNAGLQAHRAGNLDEAIATYSAILRISPEHPTARHLRGFALLQLDRRAEALPDLQAAVRIAPADGNAWTHLAVCLNRQDEPADTAARRALLLTPAAHEAMDILVREPNGPSPALTWLLAMRPGDPQVWARAGVSHGRSDPTVAMGCLRRAQCLDPGDAAVRLDLADLERRSGAPESARRLAAQALCLRPHDPRGHAERAAAATELDAVDAALTDTRLALVQEPGLAIAWGNRAETLYRMAAYRPAVRAGSHAAAVLPDDPEILTNLAAYRLASGDLAGGWPLFRNRPARRGSAGPDLPRWTGESGARLLVLAEQGLGDELLFSTLWGDLDLRVADGRLGAATIETDPRLIPLATRALPRLAWRRRLGSDDASAPFTHWCLAGDLMEILRPGIADFPGTGPGLSPDPSKILTWKQWLTKTANGRPTIGFCWRSGSLAGHRRRHYPDIAECAALLSRPDRLFVVLQYDDCDEELARVSFGAGSEAVVPPGLDRKHDQDGVAALMSALDIVVSADTAVLALAGAIGCRAVGFALHPGWVGLGQQGHPWFPRVQRIFRRPSESWTEAMEAVTAAAEAAL